MKHIRAFNEFNINEGIFTRTSKNKEIEIIEDKILDAAYSLKTFATLNKQGAFINGAKWAVHNLTDDEIKKLRDNIQKDEFSFFGIK